MKKVICILITVIVLLYAVSIGAMMELFLEAKQEEFYNANYFMPTQHENEIIKQYTDGEITFEDLKSAIVEYDVHGLMLSIPYTTCYMRFMDSAGTTVSESGMLLNLKVTKESPFKQTNKYIDLGTYLTEDFKNKYAESAIIVNSVELYRENDNFVPVAINVTWFDLEGRPDERIVFTDYQTNVTCVSDYGVLSWENNEEQITAEVNVTPLRMEKKKGYDYFKSLADSYAQQAKTSTITDGVTGSGGRMDGDRFFETSYSVLNVSVGPYTYYTFRAIGVDLLAAVFDETSYVNRLVAVTAIYVLLGAVASGTTVYIFKKEYE